MQKGTTSHEVSMILAYVHFKLSGLIYSRGSSIRCGRIISSSKLNQFKRNKSRGLLDQPQQAINLHILRCNPAPTNMMGGTPQNTQHSEKLPGQHSLEINMLRSQLASLYLTSRRHLSSVKFLVSFSFMPFAEILRSDIFEKNHVTIPGIAQHLIIILKIILSSGYEA